MVRASQISDLEKIALKDGIRIKILELIDLDLKIKEELRNELELQEHELNEHLALLERAMLLVRDDWTVQTYPEMCSIYRPMPGLRMDKIESSKLSNQNTSGKLENSSRLLTFLEQTKSEISKNVNQLCVIRLCHTDLISPY
ncbi:MAG: hypothetical protein MUO26_12985 [Methanotrichaceae archaeon]|nr:hypothetical protein [Methanotrichaceae archaeon]